MNRQIIHGDSKLELKKIKDNSVDCMVTDPPYGYSFMGKDWDKAVIGVDIWKECLRVLKPGAFAFIMSAPRQDVLSRMLVNLKDSGFVISFTSTYWSYATGFVKAANISKLVDKKLGHKREQKRVSGGRLHHNNILNDDKWSNIGQKTPLMDSDVPISEQAKKLNGSYAGFQPKPAVEVIITVMKPLSEGNYTEQAMQNCKGITWLDDCRIPFVNDDDKESTKTGYTGSKYETYIKGTDARDINNENPTQVIANNTTTGRFPANLLVSDDVLNDGKITKSSKRNDKHGCKTKGFFYEGEYYNDQTERGYTDTGSFSRYFDLCAWAKSHLSRFIITPKPSKSEKEKGLEKFTETTVSSEGRKTPNNTPGHRGKVKRKNTHPTVKPVSLFSYLITMGSRPNDTILDPFLGSGTCGIAAEMLARDWIGIELDENHVRIAKGRLEKHLNQQKMEEFC